MRHVAIRELHDLHPLEPLVYQAPALGLGDAPHAQAELHILLYGEEGKQCQALPDHRRIALPGRQFVDALAAEPDFAFAWHFEARQHPQHRRLAAAARPHDREELAFRSEEHTSELQSLMRISYAVFCLKKKKKYPK